MAVLWVIIFMLIGVILGAIANQMCEQTELSWNITWGIVGSLLLPLIFKIWDIGKGITAWSWQGLVFSILGACIALLIYWLAKGRTEA